MTTYHAKIRGLKLVRSFVNRDDRDAWVAGDPEHRIKVKKHRNSYLEAKR
jgi:hypothetical protein